MTVGTKVTVGAEVATGVSTTLIFFCSPFPSFLVILGALIALGVRVALLSDLVSRWFPVLTVTEESETMQQTMVSNTTEKIGFLVENIIIV